MPVQRGDATPVEVPPTGSVSTGDAAVATGGASGAPFRLGNRPALTGIRAVGVSLVLIFHSNFQTLPGSWVALGVFFVLSGFLITTMLATEHQKNGNISLSKFYYRRAVRLLPPLVMTVALLALYALIIPVWNAPQRIWGDSAAALFYFADYRSAFGHEPWGGFMAQCWSLAVEEQFYLIWAALLLVTLKFGNRKLAYAMAIAGIVVCAANRVRIVLEAAHWNSYVAGRVYYAFDTRADALFLGCLLGLVATGGHLDGWKPWAKRMLTVLAVASTGIMVWIILSVSLAPRSLPMVWLPVSEVASALIIVYFIVQPKGLGTRLMGLSALVFVGNMSYTIYLIHWPIYVAISPFTVRWSYPVMDLARAALIIPIALASWFLVERPLTKFRRGKLDPVSGPTRAESAPPVAPEPALTNGLVVPVAVSSTTE
jgi:peptidoglycan/LPS O-acetylase OafA/YrhL